MEQRRNSLTLRWVLFGSVLQGHQFERPARGSSEPRGGGLIKVFNNKRLPA